MKFIIPAFQGINNVDNSYAPLKVQMGEDVVILNGDLSDSRNFVLTKDGIASTRNGRTIVCNCSTARSFFVDHTGTRALFVDGTSLYKLNADYSRTALYTVQAGRRMCYEEHYGSGRDYQIFMGNGFQMLKLKDDVVSAWGDTSLISEEFELPQRTYQKPPYTNIIRSYYDRMWAADGRFALYSESTLPERFRRANNIPVDGEITEISADRSALYIHTRETTVSLIGRSPNDFISQVFPIGAIKHGAINIRGQVYVMSPYGWAMAHDGIIEYIDEPNYRLDLPSTAEAWMGYNQITREVMCPVRT